MSYTTVIEAYFHLLRETPPPDIETGVASIHTRLSNVELDPLVFIASRFRPTGCFRTGAAKIGCTEPTAVCPISSAGFAGEACAMPPSTGSWITHQLPILPLVRDHDRACWAKDCRMRLLAAPIQFDSPLPALQAVVRYLIHRFGVERVKEVIPSRPVDPNPL